MPSSDTSQASSKGAEVDLPRLLAREAVREARARLNALNNAAPPSYLTGREAAEAKIRSVFATNLAGSNMSSDRKRAAVSWVAPGRDWTGIAASGVLLMRQEFNFARNAKTNTIPAVVLTSHAMKRLVEREGAQNLDEFLVCARPVLGWAEVARQARVEGDFLVPTKSGIWCCGISRRGLAGPDGKEHDVAVLKTFIDHSRIMLALETIYARLMPVVENIDLRFPFLDAPGSKELFAMADMAAAGAERQADETARENRRTHYQSRRSSQAMGF